MITRWIPGRVWLLSLILFSAVSGIYLGFYRITPENEVRVEVNGLAITDGQIADRMNALRKQNTDLPEHDLKELAVHELIQERVVDYEILNRHISRDEVFDFLSRVKREFVAPVKKRYLDILESHAVVVRHPDPDEAGL